MQIFHVKIDSMALGKKYIAKDASLAKQRYTNDANLALRVGEFKDAKELAKNWAERTGNVYVVLDGAKELARFKRTGKSRSSART